jgi:hypothetical protein
MLAVISKFGTFGFQNFGPGCIPYKYSRPYYMSEWIHELPTIHRNDRHPTLNARPGT